MKNPLSRVTERLRRFTPARRRTGAWTADAVTDDLFAEADQLCLTPDLDPATVLQLCCTAYERRLEAVATRNTQLQAKAERTRADLRRLEIPQWARDLVRDEADGTGGKSPSL